MPLTLMKPKIYTIGYPEYKQEWLEITQVKYGEKAPRCSTVFLIDLQYLFANSFANLTVRAVGHRSRRG